MTPRIATVVVVHRDDHAYAEPVHRRDREDFHALFLDSATPDMPAVFPQIADRPPSRGDNGRPVVF